MGQQHLYGCSCTADMGKVATGQTSAIREGWRMRLCLLIRLIFQVIFLLFLFPYFVYGRMATLVLQQEPTVFSSTPVFPFASSEGRVTDWHRAPAVDITTQLVQGTAQYTQAYGLWHDEGMRDLVIS